MKAFQDWPPNEIVPALSLAQHCELPTCLLDFSWNPYVAAYFAARGVMENVGSRCKGAKTLELQDDKFICVWVVNDGQLALTFDSPRHSIKLFAPPASDNRTLQAQEGLFMWSPISIHDGWDAATGFDPGEPAESILSEPSSGCTLTKVLLKETEAKMLLHRLIKLGIDGARLFPTYKGAARATDEHTWARIGP